MRSWARSSASSAAFGAGFLGPAAAPGCGFCHIAAGVGRHLKVCCDGPRSPDEETKEAAATLAGLLVAQLDCFPALEEMTVSWPSPPCGRDDPDADLVDFFAGLAQGGAPRL